MMTARQALDMNYNIHISEEFGFVFFNNPKAGCSTTKATLNLACAKRLGVPLEYRAMSDIHSRAFNILKTPKQMGGQRTEQMINDPATFRFCVLREPISRTASAYSSKFRGHSPQMQRLNEFLGRPSDQPWPNINEFVAAITSDNKIRDFDPHWRLQYLQVGAAKVDMTLVGFQEELDVSLRKFSRQVFGDEDIEIFDARDHFRQNISRGKLLAQTLTPESLRLLREAYAEDFEFYRREWMRMHPGAEALPQQEALAG